MRRIHIQPIFTLLILACAWGCSYSSTETDALACEDGDAREGQICVDGFWVSAECTGEECCVPQTCESLGAECGTVDDGCGTTIECGGCTAGEVCGESTANQCDAPNCEPRTCADLQAECGEIDPGCGLPVETCGECEDPQTCGVLTANQCGCEPTTCVAEQAECGMIDDGCGESILCGECDQPESCGGGEDSAPNVCGCTPTTTCQTEAIGCGSFTNDCDTEVQCSDGCFEEVAVFERHACAIDMGAAGIKCWGDNSQGQLGQGDIADYPRAAAVEFSDDTISFIDVAVGTFHSCALAADGTVWCWGDNSEGQLGVDPEDAGGPGQRSTKPMRVPDVTNATTLSAAAAHTCAIESDQTIKCWGENSFDELGVTGASNVFPPAEVTGVPTPITDISTGPTHTCAIGNASVYCWGSDSAGQLGVGPGSDDSANPALAADSAAYIAVTTGLYHTCALTDSGSADCWGAIQYDGTVAQGTQQTPAAKTIAQMTTAISARHTSTCSIHAAGLQCFGTNASGELGDGSTEPSIDPVDVVMLSAGISISSGVGFSCAVTPQNVAHCWGRNNTGQLGDGTTMPSLTPVEVVP